MKSRIMVYVVLAFMLGACVLQIPPAATITPVPPFVQPTPTQAPTLPPANTPVLPTPTLSPIQEPSPTPEPTLTITPSPAPITTTAPKTQIPTEALMTLLTVGNSLYQSGEYVMASTLYTEMLSRDPDPEVYALRADTYNRMGDFDAAISDYLAALDLGTDNDTVLNNLCWDLGITGQAEKALPYCEQAVASKASASYRDSRGVVYAQLGMVQEAVADFQAVADDLKSATDSSLRAIAAERQEWITSLKQGVNPITPEVLTQLRGDDIAIAATSTPVPSTVVVPCSALQEAAGEAGFMFDKPDASEGAETLTGNRAKGSCKAVLELVGPETGLTAASLQASGCSDDEQSGLAYWFMAALLPGEREQAKAIVYMVLNVYYVIEGEVETTGEQAIGNVIFETRRSEVPAPVFEITARVKS